MFRTISNKNEVTLVRSSRFLLERYQSNRVYSVSKLLYLDDLKKPVKFEPKDKEIPRDDNEASVQSKQKFLVPHVPNIDYISRKDIELEKLFAREKPLFLGKFPLDLASTGNSAVQSLGDFLETLQQTATAEDAKSTQIKIININDKGQEAEDNEGSGNDPTVTTGNLNNILDKLKGTQVSSLTPWEASISGVAFKDEAIKNVPRSILERMKPFKFEPLDYSEFEKKKNTKKKSGGGRKKTLLSKRNDFRVYTSRINNSIGYVDLNDIPLFYQPPKLNDPFDTLGEIDETGKTTKNDAVSTEQVDSASGTLVEQQFSYDPTANPNTLTKIRTERRKYIMHLASEYNFIKEDQSTLRNEIMKLNRFLSKEFEKMKNISIQNEFRNYVMPLYIYIDRSMTGKKMFSNYLKKMIMSHIEPLLETVCSAFEDKKHADSFRDKVKIKVHNAIQNLQDEVPSIYFTTDGIDCILKKSAVKGFGKIYWLKKSSRQTYIFNKKNSDKSYIIGCDQSSYIKRSGLKNMKYQIRLVTEKFNDAFKRWEDYI